MISIRKYRPDDAGRITEIYNHYITHTTITFETEPLTVEEMSARLDSIAAEYPLLVAEDADGCIAGYAYAHQWKQSRDYRPTAETTLYVDSRHQGHGTGTALLRRLIEECRCDASLHALIACITADNAISRRLHEREGFLPVSEFKAVGLKFGRRLDVVDYELIVG